jgi:hypothetical protein
MAHAAVAPTAHQGGPLKIPSSRLRLARGHTPPSGGFRPDSRECAYLEQAPPRSRVPRHPRAGPASLEGAPHTHAHSRTRVRAFNALTKAGRRHHAPGTRAPVLSHQLPKREPSPPRWGTVRRGRCQSRDAAPPTPVRLTRRALEGGPAAPSICFPVTLQG